MSNPNTAQRPPSLFTRTRALAHVAILFSLCSLSTLSFLAPLAQKAYAQTTEGAIFHKMTVRAGEAYKAKRYREAIKHYEDALVLRFDPNIHWNLYVCYHKLKNLPKALHHVNEYIRLGRLSPKLRQKAEARRAKLLSALEARLDSRSDIRPVPLNDREAGVRRSDNERSDVDQRWSSPSQQSQTAHSDASSGSLSLTSHQKRGILWGGLGLGGLIIGVGAHLYADSVWAGRPADGSAEAQSARRRAITTSWVGDGFLITGLACLTVGALNYWSDSSSSSHQEMSAQSVAGRLKRDGASELRRSRLRRFAPPQTESSLTLNLLRRPLSQANTQAQKPTQETVGAVIGWRLLF